MGFGDGLNKAFIRTLVSAGRAVTHSPLDDIDEGVHRFRTDRYWNESYYFNFHCRKTGISAFTRIGLLPGQDHAIQGLVLYTDKGLLMFSDNPSITLQKRDLAFPSLTYKNIKPMEKWAINFEGQMALFENPRSIMNLDLFSTEIPVRNVKLDLEFTGVSPVHDYKHFDVSYFAEQVVEKQIPFAELRSLTKLASNHYEQVGKYSGKITMDGKSDPIEATGHRDHSWGLRDWKIPTLWRWFTCQFPGDVAINLSRVVIGKVDIINGFIAREGRVFPVRRCTIEEKFEDEKKVFQKEVTLDMTDTGGYNLKIDGKVKMLAPLVIPDDENRTLVNEAIAHYTSRIGEGSGIAEYLMQLPPVRS